MLKAAWSDFWGDYASRIGLIFKDRNIIGK